MRAWCVCACIHVLQFAYLLGDGDNVHVCVCMVRACTHTLHFSYLLCDGDNGIGAAQLACKAQMRQRVRNQFPLLRLKDRLWKQQKNIPNLSRQIYNLKSRKLNINKPKGYSAKTILEFVCEYGCICVSVCMCMCVCARERLLCDSVCA